MLLGHHFFFLSCSLVFLPFILSHQLAFFFVYVVKFWKSIIPYFYESKVLSRSCCTKMFLNNFYLMVCSRRITSNTLALVFNLIKEDTNWNSTSALIFTSSGDFILMDEKIEKRLCLVNMFISVSKRHIQTELFGKTDDWRQIYK